MNRWGAEWRNLIQLGDLVRLRTEFDQPLGYRARFFVSPVLEYTGVESGAYLNARNRVIVEGDMGFAQFDFGYRAGNDFQFTSGVQWGFVHADLESVEGLQSVRDQLGILGFRANLDDLDSVNFPRKGEYLDARLDLGLPELGSSTEYQRLYLNLVQPLTGGNTSLVLSVEGGSDLGSDLPLYEEFTVGGLLRLSGFDANELRGDQMFRGGVIWMQRLGRLNPLLGKGVYAGISLEAGNALASGESWQLEALIPAGSVFAGVDSVLGPFYLGWGVAEGGIDSFYFLLGHPYQLGILH
jgi:NTE family protein